MKVTQLCSTLCNPMDYTVHGILQARILEWVAFPFSRGSSQPRDHTQVSCIAGVFLTTNTTWEAPYKLANHHKLIHKSSNTPIKRLILTSPFFCGSWKLITKLEKAYTENWFIKDVALPKSGEQMHNWWIKNGLDLRADFMCVFILWKFIKMYS